MICSLALGPVATLAHAQISSQPTANTANAWIGYDWLKPAEDQQRQAASGTTATATTSQDVKDPLAVLSNGTLWQEKQTTVCRQKLADPLTLSYETSSTVLSESPTASLPNDGSPEDLSRGQKAALQFQAADPLTLSADLHNSTTDAALPGDAQITNGTGLTAEGHLPADSTLTLGYRADHTAPDANSVSFTTNTAYDAQFKQPLGKLPLTATFKGHYETVGHASVPTGRAPSLEQSLTWKPLADTTVQMGLRQQQYQEYPGVNNEFNEALFADWSQKMAGDVSWHSYAEVLNSRGMIDQAPATPIASGANGTAQATTPGSNVSPVANLPVSLEDRTLTLSTGPSFQLQKDISASVEYSNRWDQNPTAGSAGQEQRVSVSVKGTF